MNIFICLFVQFFFYKYNRWELFEWLLRFPQDLFRIVCINIIWNIILKKGDE